MKTAIRFGLRFLSVVLFAAVLCLILTVTGAMNWGGASPDAISSATAQTVSSEDMNGDYIVLLNKALHDRSGTTADWKSFFLFDENAPLIMEDINCKVAEFDSDGIDTASKYQARLPENQMNIQTEAGILMMSKAELGRFDVIILSEQAANALGAKTMFERDDVMVIRQ